jgi:hypothetical protein
MVKTPMRMKPRGSRMKYQKALGEIPARTVTSSAARSSARRHTSGDRDTRQMVTVTAAKTIFSAGWAQRSRLA